MSSDQVVLFVVYGPNFCKVTIRFCCLLAISDCHSPIRCRFDCVDDNILERHFAIEKGLTLMTNETIVGPSGQPPSEFFLDTRLLERSALYSGDNDDDDLEPLFSLQVTH